MRTRSAQKAYMRITRWLPNEVLTEIIQNAPRADQATLCRVSKLFYALALPILNRRVVLRPGKLRFQALEAFSLSMIRNPARADPVRSLTFIADGSNHVLHAEALLMECLKLMRQVERFSLRDFRPLRIGSCLPSLHFLNLWSCTLAFHAESWESHVANFLTRHPTITHLGLKMWTANGRGPLQLPQGTLLPRLQYYHGPLHLLCGFSKHSLRAIRTSWNGGDPSSFIENLRAQTGPDLGSLSLCNLAAAKVSDVLVHLSKHMSHLEKLELHFLDAPTNTAAIVNNINAYLTRSKRLAYLAMAFSTPDESDDAVVNSGNERRAFEMWTKTSPSLRGCCIGQTAWRKVGQKWEDCSKKVFLSEVGFAVFDQRANVDNH